MKVKLSITQIRSNFWYIPSLYGAIAVIFAYSSLFIDPFLMTLETPYTFVPIFLLTDIHLARTILSSISASLLTMTTITFSTILVVLTTFLSEYSPRTIQNFITDKDTQRVLGIFVGGFIYSILLLLFLRETASVTQFIVPSFAVLFSIVCIIVFVFFIRHVSTWIQVSNLIHQITLNTIQKIDSTLSDAMENHKDAPWEDWETEEITQEKPQQISFIHAGYIKHINIEGLVEQATKDDIIIKIEKNISEYVDNDTPLLSIWGAKEKVTVERYKDYFSIGTEKAPIDNIEFGLTKLVEITLRALSSGINDPNTAINCIENIGKILTKLGSKHLPRSYHNDKNRNLRVIYDKPNFNDYLYKCFYQIRQYGFQDISVLSASIKAFTLIAETNSKEIKSTIWEFTKYIVEGIEVERLLSLDRNYINQKIENLAKVTGHINEYKPL
ncbi:DUF2254 domain-containing protein [Anaerobacillus alkalilacustris]|nr:DUF2254 domain-containing protein [Anaerobacillus alkalilacustris]